MATSNINKIVRGNLNLKPWILSKNSADIINGYVQRLYEQIPNKFKNDLLQPRVAERQHIRKSAEHSKAAEKFVLPIVNRPKPKIRPNGYRSPPLMSTKNSFVAAPKKFLKPPVYKIYNSRKYSSASSSSASFLRNNPEENRKIMYKPAAGMQYRTFKGTAAQMPGADFYCNPGVAKYIAPSRVYNSITDEMKTLNITSAICKDLMSVNDGLKKKIRLNKIKLASDSTEAAIRRDPSESPFQGWNHPATSQLSKTPNPFFLKKPPLTIKNNDSDRRIHMVDLISGRKKAFSSREYSPYLFATRENARYEMLKIPPYTGANIRPASKKTETDSENGKTRSARRVSHRETQAQRVNDFVCRSRTARMSNKSMNHRV